MNFKTKVMNMALILVMMLNAQRCASQKREPLNYPATKTEVQTMEYHGEQVADRFGWLGNATTQSTKDWAKAQDDFFRKYVEAWPGYSRLQKKVQDLMGVTGRTELPVVGGDKTFFLRDNEQGKWHFYKREGGTDKSVFGDTPPFNPRAFYFYVPSPDGRYVAMAMATGYFDWKVLDVSTGKLLEATLQGKGLGGTRLAWSRDSKSFYYVGSTNTNDQGQRSGFVVKRHIVGKEAAADKTVFKPKSDGSKLELSVCRGGDYLIIEEREGAATPAMVHYMVTKTDEVVPLIKEPTASFIFLGNDGRQFYFETDNEAPSGRVVAIHLDRPQPENWKELIPEQDRAIMGYQSAGGTFLPLMADNKFVIPYQHNLKQYLNIFDLQGKKLREIELPSGGLYFNTNGLNALSGNRESRKVLTRFIGITEPNTILEIDVNSGEVKPFSRANTNFDAGAYQSEIVFCSSQDGTKVPISLTYKKGIRKNGKNPLLMQVYGAIAFTNYPYFQGDYIAWLEMGGIHAVAHIRGGGALGSGWHQNGIARKKQNGIDDYIAALEFVTKQKYTSSDRLVVNGVSAGTIPVAAVVTQRPELVGAAVLHYGMMDMISYAERFSDDANHAYMIPEIGTAANKEDFDVLKSYSPYQNIKQDRCYPAVLALTSESDTPLDTDSYRFIAALQGLDNNCADPYLLQMAWGSGHSAFGSQTHPSSKTFTDEMAFLIRSLDLDVESWLSEK